MPRRRRRTTTHRKRHTTSTHRHRAKRSAAEHKAHRRTYMKGRRRTHPGDTHKHPRHRRHKHPRHPHRHAKARAHHHHLDKGAKKAYRLADRMEKAQGRLHGTRAKPSSRYARMSTRPNTPHAAKPKVTKFERMSAQARHLQVSALRLQAPRYQRATTRPVRTTRTSARPH